MSGDNQKPYDSTEDTLDHIAKVRSYLHDFCRKLIWRGKVHDDSKLKSPEKEIFDEYTPKLRETAYGSDEYKKFLKEMQVALDHHYANNSHHPEFYEEGIEGMCLVDLVEMLIDWKAATERHDDGDLLKSIEQNQKRFDYSDDLKSILRNTAIRHFGAKEKSNQE